MTQPGVPSTQTKRNFSQCVVISRSQKTGRLPAGPGTRPSVNILQGVGPTNGRARDYDILELGGSAGSFSPEKQWGGVNVDKRENDRGGPLFWSNGQGDIENSKT